MGHPLKNLILLPLLFFILFACRKESFTSNADFLLRTSIDSLHFDTVFTSTGSVTQQIRIFNDHDKGIHINSIRLSGGALSPFKININGEPGPEALQVDLDANDSAYIFVKVYIDPTATNLPFLIRDSIEIAYNGNKKYIQLDAYGRNAHFLRNRIITSDESWDNDLPYVILGGLVVDSNATLTINNGCHIYLHSDAPFIVHGSMQVKGNDSSRVLFLGDRTDDPYRNFPGSYPGLIFSQASKNNILQFCTIENAYQGILLQDNLSGGTKLTLQETVIDNAYDAGIISVNSSISARNILVSNCGKSVELINGGNYEFIHCTVAAYSNNFIQHKDPLLLLSDNSEQNNSAVYTMNALFRNCIFWAEKNGMVDNDIIVSRTNSATFNVIFDHILWDVKSNPPNASVLSVWNMPPEFDSINISDRFYNFHLKSSSPAIDAGIDAGIKMDLDGKPRPVGLPDLGCYERQ